MKIVRYLPPSPNWYSGCASLCVESSTFAYASLKSVILLNSDRLDYVGTLKGHTDKVNSVSVAGNYCASGSSDKTIKYWDITTRKLLNSITLKVLFVNRYFCFFF